jgi:PAS domain S-box-containing protein
MKDLKEYEEAIAMYNKGLSIKTVPIYSWNFHDEFLISVRNFFLDLNRLNLLAVQSHWVDNDWDLSSSLKEEVVIVTDVKLNIIFASHNIKKMNGYAEAEVLGKSPKMFQGKVTNDITSNEIRKAIINEEAFEKTVLNYKKNGDVYVCLIKGYPVFNSKGQLSHYIAFEKAA